MKPLTRQIVLYNLPHNASHLVTSGCAVSAGRRLGAGRNTFDRPTWDRETKWDTMTDTNDSGATAQAGGETAAPGMHILGQYIKDLSFENPNAPRCLQQGEQPKLDINVNVGAQQLGEGQFEVTLTLNAKAQRPDITMFNVELVYAGLFRITGVPNEHMHPFVMIECPRMIFPFARNILAEATRNGGFPPLLLDPIDFAQLYRQNMAQQAAAAEQKPN